MVMDKPMGHQQGYEEMTDSKQTGSNYQGNQPNYIRLIFAALFMVLIIGLLFKSRWYFRSYFLGPRDVSFREIEEAVPTGMKQNWVRLKVPKLLPTGYETVVEEHREGTPVPVSTRVVSKLMLVPINKRFLVANVNVDHPRSELIGALQPMSVATRNLLCEGIPQKEFDKSILPFVLETNAFKTQTVIFQLICAGLGLILCGILVVRDLTRMIYYNIDRKLINFATPNDGSSGILNSHAGPTEVKAEGWSTKIDEDLLDWEMRHWKWLDENLSPHHDLGRIHLVLPTSEDFPVVAGTDEERANKTFQCVKKHFGLEAWPCILVPFKEVHDEMRDLLPVLARPEEAKGAAGMFQVTKDREATILYKPDQAKDPTSMVATMAHETCHYVLATIRAEPPCGQKQHEPLTDLTAVFFGFGIFLANSSFRFSQWQDQHHQGWSAKRQGYLSEKALSLALALFCVYRNIDPDVAKRYLATNPRYYFRKYYKELCKRRIRTIKET